MTEREFITVQDVLDCHAEFGRLDRAKVKLAMGPNWPRDWDEIPDDEDSIFERNDGQSGDAT